MEVHEYKIFLESFWYILAISSYKPFVKTQKPIELFHLI